MFSHEQLVLMFTEYRQMPSETEWLEFKEAKTNFSFDELGRYFSALSNEANLKGRHSAWLIFGLKDKFPREIVGTRYRPERAGLDSLKHEVVQQTNGITFQEIYELSLSEGRVLMFQIPAAPAGIPTSWKGHYWGRDGESLAPLAINEMETIRGQVGHRDWTAEICPQATINDLAPAALHIARQNFSARIRDARFGHEMEKWDEPTFLDKAKLTRNGQLTRAAILLLGNPEAAHHLNPYPAQITWKLQADEEAYEHFGPPFLLNVEELFKRIRNIKFRIQPFNQLIPVELTKYDPKIILEALNNCIAHQDYSRNARIIVTEKVDRLILRNVGSFYDGTVEDYVLHERTPERYRNPFLTQAMVSLNMIDTMGLGIRRMFLGQRKRYFPLPEYDLSDPDHVQITIFGKLIDENYSRVLMEEQDLTLSDVVLLDRIQKKLTVDRAHTQTLRKRNLIEGRYPNLFISAKVAKTTGQKAEYTKHRAFDKQYYKDLVLKFLDQHNEAGPEDFQELLLDKFSDLLSVEQKKAKVRNLLQEMSSQDGTIRNVGGRGLRARWRRVLD
ncbi:MAG: ATP-binding protein [Desulfuromonadaceae bacterium]|nr:ATP-binding protein [Desulfuromonadaceae bacterium]